ncbi:MAG TPA: hypothetical protein VFU93_12110 [Acidimicrobiales bacterium]|nr:hypothetical protein [Acidimicrobiales bacterium]
MAPDLSELVSRRWDGTFEVDPWGLDVDLLHLVAPLADARWSISVEGEDVLRDGPVLLVAGRRLLAPTEPAVIAAAVFRSVSRPLRVLGIPDVAPIGPLLRRFGGVVDHPAEAAALLRAGHLVLARQAFEVDAPIVRVTTRGWELSRRWRVTFD